MNARYLMGFVAIALAACGSAGAPRVAPLGAPMSPVSGDAAVITIRGEGRVPVPADRAEIRIDVELSDSTPLLASARRTEVANHLRAAIEAVGIPADSITSTGGRRGHYYSYWPARDEVRVFNRDTTYIARDIMTVAIRRLELVGPVLDVVQGAGVARVSNVQVSATETGEANLEAVRRATESARARAEVIAEAAGGRLGRLIEITSELPDRYGMDRDIVITPAVLSSDRAAQTSYVAPALEVRVILIGRWEFLRD